MKSLKVYHHGVYVEAFVDNDDYEYVKSYSWHVDNSGYIATSLPRESGKRTTLRLHRFILGLPKGIGIVDHENGNKLDNTQHNLIITTQQKNSENQAIINNRGISKYRGVTQAMSGRWRARVFTNGKECHLGVFDNEEEAHEACMQFRKQNNLVIRKRSP